MVRHVIAKCTNGKIFRFPIEEETNRIRLAKVGFREMAKTVETIEDARDVFRIMPLSAPILDIRIVDDTVEDIHQYLEE